MKIDGPLYQLFIDTPHWLLPSQIMEDQARQAWTLDMSSDVMLLLKYLRDILGYVKERVVSMMESPSGTITIDDFRKIEMRAGTIMDVTRVPRTEKLYKIIVNLGPLGRKQAITGLVGVYSEDELLNKRIIFLCNLKEAKFAGQISQGMLLAASEGDKLAILTPDRDVPDGARVS